MHILIPCLFLQTSMMLKYKIFAKATKKNQSWQTVTISLFSEDEWSCRIMFDFNSTRRFYSLLFFTFISKMKYYFHQGPTWGRKRHYSSAWRHFQASYRLFCMFEPNKDNLRPYSITANVFQDMDMDTDMVSVHSKQTNKKNCRDLKCGFKWKKSSGWNVKLPVRCVWFRSQRRFHSSCFWRREIINGECLLAHLASHQNLKTLYMIAETDSSRPDVCTCCVLRSVTLNTGSRHHACVESKSNMILTRSFTSNIITCKSTLVRTVREERRYCLKGVKVSAFHVRFCTLDAEDFSFLTSLWSQGLCVLFTDWRGAVQPGRWRCSRFFLTCLPFQKVTACQHGSRHVSKPAAVVSWWAGFCPVNGVVECLLLLVGSAVDHVIRPGDFWAEKQHECAVMWRSHLLSLIWHAFVSAWRISRPAGRRERLWVLVKSTVNEQDTRVVQTGGGGGLLSRSVCRILLDNDRYLIVAFLVRAAHGERTAALRNRLEDVLWYRVRRSQPLLDFATFKDQSVRDAD